MKSYVLIALALAGAPSLASAQIIDQRRTDRRPPQAERPGPRPPAPAAKAVVETGAEASAVPLQSARVEGSSLPAAGFDAALRPFLGKPLTLATIKAAAQAASEVYARSDIALYTLVAPQQDLSGGQLRLVAIEGYVDQVALGGDTRGRDLTLVKAYAEKLTRTKPLRRPDLERYLSLMRDMPGQEVDAQLLQGRAPGAVILALDLHRRRAELDVSVNNRGSSLLGRTQFQADLNLYSLLRDGDQTTLTVGVPTDLDRFRYYAVTHAQPLGSEGLRVQATAGYFRTRPENPPSQGEATFGGLQVSYPLIRGYEQNLYLTGALDGLDATNAVFGQGTATEKTRALRAAAAWTRARPKYAVSASAVASLGFDGLGARTTPGLADAGFRKLNLRLGYDRALGETWVVRLRASGQASGDLLPSSEQFSLGGSEFGRAFEQSILLGDTGQAASAELAWRPRAIPKAFAGSELYGFADGGAATQKARFTTPRQTYDLSSAGAGVRLTFRRKTVIGLEGAYALRAPTPAYDKAWRLGVNLTIQR